MFFRIPDWLRYEIQQQWERLTEATRQKINQSRKIVIVVSIVSILLLLLVAIGQLTSGGSVKKIEDYKKAWFYDLNTGELFIARSDAVPPIEAPSGPLANEQPAGVRAYVFTYTYEPNEYEFFIGFLEIPDPNAEQRSTDSTQQWGQGKLIRRIYDERWVPGDSNRGRAILEKIFLPNENGETPSYYPPE